MKKFKFRFASVLRERELREQEKKRDFAVVLKVYEDAKFILANFYKAQNDNLLNLKSKKTQKDADLIKINDILNYDAFLKLQIVKQLKKIEIISEKLEEKRKIMVEAMKNRKIMEKLKERDQEVYYKDLNYQEQKETDEYSVLRTKGYV